MEYIMESIEMLKELIEAFKALKPVDICWVLRWTCSLWLILSTAYVIIKMRINMSITFNFIVVISAGIIVSVCESLVN